MPNINGVAEDIVLKSDLLNFIYPVGSYYWSAQPILPDELFGGEWEQIKDRFILAAGDNYATGEFGGEAEHVLTLDEIPLHAHNKLLTLANTYEITYRNAEALEKGQSAAIGTKKAEETYPTGYTAINTGDAGGNQPHNNMPPYEVAYCWKRIA